MDFYETCYEYRASHPTVIFLETITNIRVFPGGKVRPARAADHSPPFSAAVMEE